jgi:DNA mismatch endonuclease, patch repair protein
MDSLSKERRSWNMSRIRSRDTSPELAVRSILHRLGYRFRLHAAHLPGKPDIVLPKWKHVILVHGCFWHRHKGCKFAYTPKSRIEFWNQKFEQNMARDAIAVQKLKSLGWRVTTIWECQTKDEEVLGQRLNHLIQHGFE